MIATPEARERIAAAKSLAAEHGLTLHRVDLAQVVSKYVGETEKNLSRLFAQAEEKGWLLFFDEADALFGKRTEVKDAHDRYANIEVSYLLQRIDQTKAAVVLAVHGSAGELDPKILRRFAPAATRQRPRRPASVPKTRRR